MAKTVTLDTLLLNYQLSTEAVGYVRKLFGELASASPTTVASLKTFNGNSELHGILTLACSLVEQLATHETRSTIKLETSIGVTSLLAEWLHGTSIIDSTQTLASPGVYLDDSVFNLVTTTLNSRAVFETNVQLLIQGAKHGTLLQSLMTIATDPATLSTVVTLAENLYTCCNLWVCGPASRLRQTTVVTATPATQTMATSSNALETVVSRL